MGGMLGGLFGKSNKGLQQQLPPQAPPAPPPNPATDEGAIAARNAAAEEERRKRGNAGRASNLRTSPLGETESDEGKSARKLLLGN
jgi:hypothetical protein